MDIPFALILDLFVAVLLVVTISFAVTLNKRLGTLRGDREELQKLALSFGEATGRAMPGRYDYDYINLSRDDLEPLLERLNERRPMTFCLNDASLSPSRRTEVKQLLDEWLPRMFPAPAPWEREPEARNFGQVAAATSRLPAIT